MASFSDWLVTFRLRTLPLSLSTIILGSFLAAFHSSFHWNIFLLAVLTTLFLQTLSNLANDYGDAVHGVDNHGRIGPKRSLQTGAVTMKQMKTAIILCVIFSLISGVWLIIEGTKGLSFSYLLVLFLVGITAIVAAMKYTMGRKPYGYAGLGDIAVFVFFGLVGVMGCYFLHTHQLNSLEFLPAISIGFFSTGVLNLNNLRDKENDETSGKHTIVVALGIPTAKRYHASLIIMGIITAILYSFFCGASLWEWLYLITIPLFMRNIFVVLKNKDLTEIDPELKNLSLTTLLFSILFGIGLIL